MLPKQNLYEDLVNLPQSLTGEILNGQLHARPRPGGKHILAASSLGGDIGAAYHHGKGGPGGWCILLAPEIHFLVDEQVAVPDIAGWQKERMPAMPDGPKFSVVPDWICEVVSPSTESIDRQIKKPLYAHFGVRYLWLINPKVVTLEIYKLMKGGWVSQGQFSGHDKIRAEPFDAVEITLDTLLG